MTTALVTPSASSVKRRQRRIFYAAFAANRGALAGFFVLVLLIAVAVLAPILAPHSPIEQFRDHVLQPPFWMAGGSGSFLLGTDDLGRDILSRLLYGARLSMTIGATVVSVSLVVGSALGLLAAASNPLVDALPCGS